MADVALVLFFTGVDSGVPREARLRVEASPADVAEKLAFLFVSFFVGVKNCFACEGFLALCAFVNGVGA